MTQIEAITEEELTYILNNRTGSWWQAGNLYYLSGNYSDTCRFFQITEI